MTREDDRRRFWKRVIVGIVICLVVLPVLLVSGLALFRYRHRKPEPAQTIVPNLKGLNLTVAELRARQAGLNPQVLLSRWDIPAPVGTIVGQVPDAGASVPLGTLIGLELCVEDPNKRIVNEKRGP